MIIHCILHDYRKDVDILLLNSNENKTKREIKTLPNQRLLKEIDDDDENKQKKVEVFMGEWKVTHIHTRNGISLIVGKSFFGVYNSSLFTHSHQFGLLSFFGQFFLCSIANGINSFLTNR